MKLLRSSAAQSGFFSRLAFLAGAGFIYLLLTITPSYADDTPPVTPDSSQSPSDTNTESNPPSDPSETPLLTTTSQDSTSSTSSAPESQVTEIVTPAGDDSSYQIPLTVPIMFNGVEYTNVYATTNSVITFGQPDGTYWDYPTTPSVSLQSRDWWALPVQMPDTHFIIRVSAGGFQVDGAYRPFGSYSGSVTNIVITAQILTSGDVNYTYTVDGPLYGGERLGARLQDGTVVPLDQIGITEVDEPVELDDTPVDPGDSNPNDSGNGDSNDQTPDLPSDGSGDSGGSQDSGGNSSDSSQGDAQNPGDNPSQPNDIPSDTPVGPVNPGDIPPSSDNQQPDSSEEPTPTEPEQTQPEEPQQPTEPEENNGTDESSDEQQPEESTEQGQDNQEQDNQSEETSPEPTTTEEAVNSLLEEFGDEAVTVAALAEAGLDFSDLPPDTPVDVRTDENGNPVIITAEVAAALQLLESPAALIGGIFNCITPEDITEELTEEQKCQVLAALANIGADMSPEEREEAQKMVVATVIAAGAAINAVAAAGGATGGSSRGGGSSGGGAPTGDMKAVRRRRT